MPWYRGDLHVHTARSNGAVLTPAQIVEAARDAGLDFIAATEHNTVDGHGDWAGIGGGLVVIPGQEVVTRTGHWLAVGGAPGRLVDWRYGVRDGAIVRQLDRVRRAGGLCIAAHPHAPYLSGQLAYPFALFDAVEVWNGPWSSDLPWQADNASALAEWGRGLAAGRWRPAVGNSDAHLPGQLGTPQTVVRADSCTPRDLLAAVRAGRSWIADSAAVTLSVRVTDGQAVAGPGEHFVAGARPVSAMVSVAGVPAGVVAIHTERGVVHRASAEGEVSVELADRGSVWVSVRTSAGSLAALANPVIVG